MLFDIDETCIPYEITNKKPTVDASELLYEVDTLHDMWGLGRNGINIQSILNDICSTKSYESYISDQTYGFKALNSMLEPHLEKYFEQELNLPSLCNSKKYGQVIFPIEELMQDYPAN